MRVEGAHGAPWVVQTNVAGNLNLLAEDGDVHHRVVVLGKTGMATNTFIGESVAFISG